MHRPVPRLLLLLLHRVSPSSSRHRGGSSHRRKTSLWSDTMLRHRPFARNRCVRRFGVAAPRRLLRHEHSCQRALRRRLHCRWPRRLLPCHMPLKFRCHRPRCLLLPVVRGRSQHRPTTTLLCTPVHPWQRRWLTVAQVTRRQSFVLLAGSAAIRGRIAVISGSTTRPSAVHGAMQRPWQWTVAIRSRPLQQLRPPGSRAGVLQQAACPSARSPFGKRATRASASAHST